MGYSTCLWRSREDYDGRTRAVTDEVVATWSENWVAVNAEFDQLLQSDDDLRVFSGKMFMVWDGNHRLQAWLPIINDDHGQDQSWHFSVESIILVVNGDVASLVATLHDVTGELSIPLLSFYHYILSFYIPDN
jgi:hypothetical protein